MSDAICNCRNCHKPLTFDSRRDGEVAGCPHCGMDTVLFIPPPIKKSKEPRPISPKAALRKESAYRFGRGIMNAIQLLSVLGSAFTLGVCIRTIHGYYPILLHNPFEHLPDWPFIGIGVAVTNLILISLLYHVVQAFFDIADAALKNKGAN